MSGEVYVYPMNSAGCSPALSLLSSVPNSKVWISIEMPNARSCACTICAERVQVSMGAVYNTKDRGLPSFDSIPLGPTCHPASAKRALALAGSYLGAYSLIPSQYPQMDGGRGP